MSTATALERSTVLTAIVTALAGSRLRASLGTATSNARSTLRETRAWLAGSRLVTTTNRATRSLSRTTETSATTELTTTLARYVRASFLYRWLTAEPEPEVIVIDLRDTFSVGPVIALLDRAVRATVPASHRSTVHAAVTRTVEESREAPIRAASLVLVAATCSFLLVAALRGLLTTTVVALTAVLLALSLAGLRSTRSWDDVRESRPVQLLIAALEPPEPPEEYRREDE